MRIYVLASFAKQYARIICIPPIVSSTQLNNQNARKHTIKI